MRINYSFFFLFFSIFFFSNTAGAQNFDETWKEFLENNKISNMSRLSRPDKVTDRLNYSKYLLMNTNNRFCQSKVETAVELMAELKEIDYDMLESIPGFVPKMDDLETKIKAYHSIDKIWNRFLKTKVASVEELEEIYPPSSICEKHTLVKYSYMTAYSQLCDGNIAKSKSTFERRTLKIAEKTTLKVRDVKGMAPLVRDMKKLYQALPKLDDAWETYIETGVSPGFKTKLPVFSCYPIPNLKALVLNGAADLCGAGPEMFDEIKKLQAESGVVPDRELRERVKDLEDSLGERKSSLSALNKAWKSFVNTNQVKKMDYGYDYCTREPLIRAYIMDGFSFVCEMAEESLQKIDSLERLETRPLKKSTIRKIDELQKLAEEYDENAVAIEKLWNKFIAQGDTLYTDYQSTEIFCDNIHQVKDWVMNGLMGNCEKKRIYLEKIDKFKESFDFSFTDELECRVQKLRVSLWDCQYELLQKLARADEEAPSYEDKLQEIMEQYEMGERPEVCIPNE